MKKHLIFTLLTLSFLAMVTPALAASPSPTSTNSGEVDLDTIKENVKKRIESVVKGETNINLQQVPAAYMGKVESLTSNTLSLLSTAGTKQISTTPGTTILRLPGSKAIKFEDISIDEYATALGYLNPDGVLQTKRLLVQAIPPSPSPSQAYFGTITAINAKTRTITIQDPITQESIDFIISRKATGTPITSLLQNMSLLVIYTPGAEKDDDNIIDTIRVKSSVLGISSASATASPSASPKLIPPELRK